MRTTTQYASAAVRPRDWQLVCIQGEVRKLEINWSQILARYNATIVSSSWQCSVAGLLSNATSSDGVTSVIFTAGTTNVGNWGDTMLMASVVLSDGQTLKQRWNVLIEDNLVNMDSVEGTPVVPTEPEVGLYSGFDPPKTTFFAPGCGGEDVEEVVFFIHSNTDTPCTVKVRTVDGHYTAGVDYEAVDMEVELPGTDENPDAGNALGVRVVVTVNNPAAACPTPFDVSNPAFSLELYDPVDCGIGGAMTHEDVEYTLYESTSAIAEGI